MRIHRVAARNYRILKDTTVELDPSLTVIGGPNETGKSTLMEAAHRALFLRATYNGSAREEMLPWDRAGHPEVEMEFTLHRVRWTLQKVFSGSTGEAILVPEGGVPLRGDEAEERLAQLLGGIGPASGRGASTQLSRMWRHLWVRHGDSGTAPGEALGDQASALLHRLQEVGDSAVLMTNLDARVMQRIEDDWSRCFTAGGSPSKASALSKCRAAREVAAAQLKACAERIQGRSEVARTLSTAEEFLARAEDQEKDFEDGRRQVVHQLNDARRNEEILEGRIRARVEAEERRGRLEDGHRKIQALEEEVASLRTRIAPMHAAAEEAEAREQRAAQAVEERRSAIVKVRDEFREARASAGLARATLDMVRAEAQRRQLLGRQEELKDLGKELAAERARFTAIPQIKGAELRSLEELARKSAAARTALEATAASVVLISCAVEVTLDGLPLRDDAPRTLIGDGELQIGEVARLRIRPGGGGTLEQAQQDAHSAEEALKDALLTLGVGSLEEAQEAHLEAIRAATTIQGLETAWARGGGETLKQELQRLESAVREARREVAVRGGSLEGTAPDLDRAQQALLATAGRSRVMEGQERQAEIALGKAEEAAREAHDHRVQVWQAAEEIRRKLNDRVVRLDVALKQSGVADVRRQAIALAREAENKALATESRAKEKLAGMDVDQLSRDQERLTRALEHLASQVEEAKTRRDRALGVLHSDGHGDPYAQLAEARAALDQAERREAAAESDSEAINLLYDEFREARTHLGTVLARPLADGVRPYLRDIFGSAASATVEFRGLQIGDTRLDRGTRFSFTRLSVGAKEQFALAFRLVATKHLSEPFGGTLPLLLDDAFAHSDESRIRGLQHALDLAARNGLQIVLLTCRPEAWGGLGAKMVSLDGSAETSPRPTGGDLNPHRGAAE